MKILSVVATRPNFVKIAPFCKAIEQFNIKNKLQIQHILVHTGQHYDPKLSDQLFYELEIPNPDLHLEIGSGTHAEQVGNTMIAFEKILITEKPDWVIVLGDVNATMACTLASKKLGIKVCHIEAGIRSFDMEMPEEINRIVTDSIADLLLTPDDNAVENLVKEGKSREIIHFVGNIMIDTLDLILPKVQNFNIQKIIVENSISTPKDLHDDFGIITLHRPSNVDNEKKMSLFINWLKSKEQEPFSFIWTIHPRTLKMLEQFKLLDKLCQLKNCILLHPISYKELLFLNAFANLMFTDSGGLQEECCVLGTPFAVLRNNSERNKTLKEFGGIGHLIGNSFENLEEYFSLLTKEKRNPTRPEKWDGKTAERCLIAILKQNH